MKSDPETEINDELIVRYLSGEASPEEALTLMDWLTVPANQQHFDKLESVWQTSAAVPKASFDTVAAWNNLHDTIGKETGAPQGKVISFRWTIGIAASLVIVILAVVMWKRSAPVTYATATSGEESKVLTLADQSNITLYRHSIIKYPTEFEKRSRELTLTQGEAFFEIAKDASRPFIVHTSGADIRVVGTAFNVTIDQDQTEIIVKEGKVLVYANQDSALLTPGFKAVFKSRKKIEAVQQVADSNVWSYATHKLVFKDTPLKEVVKELEKAYPCTITFANDQISHCKLTATFDNDTLDKIVTLIAESLTLGVRKNGTTFVFEGEGCP